MKKVLRVLILFTMLFALTACTIDNPFKDDDDNYSRTRDRKSSSPSPSPSDSGSNPGDVSTPKPSVAPISGVYNVGEKVTVNGEPFYVLEASDDSMGTVVLLAVYNLDKEGNKQLPDATNEETKVDFCSEVYWQDRAKAYYDKNGRDGEKFCINDVKGYVKGDAMYKAKEYASKLGAIDGGLPTYEQVEELRVEYPVMMCGQENNMSTDNDYAAYGLYFWTSSVYSFSDYDWVYQVRGNNGGTNSSPINVDGAWYGVRPVITISKDLVERQ